MQKFPKYRPHYYACMLDGAKLAAARGLTDISAAEFGVAGGNGLVAMERYSKLILKKTGVRIHTFGFDMGNAIGLPQSKEPRDILYLWQPGDYKMDEAALRSRLNSSKLYLGDVGQKIHDFANDKNPPLAICFFDLDYYSSTAAALKIFDLPTVEHLPRVTCYFDDVDVSSQFNGVLGAIFDYNSQENQKKIFQMSGHYHMQTYGMLANRVFHLHSFLQPGYNQYIPGITVTELKLKN